MPKIYAQHSAVNGKRLLTVVSMTPSIDELVDGHPQQVKMTFPPRSVCSEAHVFFHVCEEYELKTRRNARVRVWTEDDVDLGTWGILCIKARVITLHRE